MIAACAAVSPDAITILCTNMKGAKAAAEHATGPMVLDSVAVTLWGCLMAIGVRPVGIRGYGRIFSDPRLKRKSGPILDGYRLEQPSVCLGHGNSLAAGTFDIDMRVTAERHADVVALPEQAKPIGDARPA